MMRGSANRAIRCGSEVEAEAEAEAGASRRSEFGVERRQLSDFCIEPTQCIGFAFELEGRQRQIVTRARVEARERTAEARSEVDDAREQPLIAQDEGDGHGLDSIPSSIAPPAGIIGQTFSAG